MNQNLFKDSKKFSNVVKKLLNFTYLIMKFHNHHHVDKSFGTKKNKISWLHMLKCILEFPLRPHEIPHPWQWLSEWDKVVQPHANQSFEISQPARQNSMIFHSVQLNYYIPHPPPHYEIP